MRRGHFILLVFNCLLAVSILSCKEDQPPVPSTTFTESEGIANNKGEYLLTGTILSEVQLDKVVLTKEGTVSPALTIAGVANSYTDNSTAKNKTEYEFAYQIAGITANTYIVMDIYDQSGTRKTVKFLIKAFSNI